MDETKKTAAMRIEVYLDDAQEPMEVYEPPARFELDTLSLEDGRHTLKIVAIDRTGRRRTRIVPFDVHNGPTIACDGLPENGEVQGKVGIMLNAYGAYDKEWEVATAENPRPVAAWVWLILIGVAAWATFYGIAMWRPPPKYADTPTYGNVQAAAASSSAAPALPSAPSSTASASSKGAELYSTHCAGCHQANGEGVPGLFPPLKGAPAVTAKDPTEQIRIVLFGLSGKKVAGKSYSGTMPAHKSMSDQEIADVINYERTSWGNNAPTVTARQVAKVRKEGPPAKKSGGGG